MIGSLMDRVVKRRAKVYYRDFMSKAGIRRTMEFSKRYNRIRYRARRLRHEAAYRDRIDELLEVNGWKTEPHFVPRMTDGYHLMTDCRLPHLDRLLAEADPLIDERGGIPVPSAQYPGKPFFQSLEKPGDLEACPSFLDFATSSELLSAVADYMGTIPVLSKTMPPGIRFVESNAAYDEPGKPYYTSQLFHLDIHDDPLVYVIVLLRDVTMECGPWCFLPASVSERAAARLNYREKGSPYRVTDERMYEHVDPSELIPLTYPKGTVLLLDSSRCFHYGSRNSEVPRFQMMYAYTTPCRTDMTEIFKHSKKYPLSDSDSPLRRMVLE